VPLGQDLVPRRETAPRSCPGGPHSHSSRKIRRSAISCPSGLSWSCRMTSAWTSLGRSGPEGDPDATLVRARQRGEPHPPKTPGRERISGLALRPSCSTSSCCRTRAGRPDRRVLGEPRGSRAGSPSGTTSNAGFSEGRRVVQSTSLRRGVVWFAWFVSLALLPSFAWRW
jgi:hypothetical protein